MLDVAAILQRVQSGETPPQWRVYHAQRGYFITNILVGVFLAVGAVVGGLWLATSRKPLGLGLPDKPSAGDLAFWLVVDSVALLVAFVLGAAIAIRESRALTRRDEQLLVLTPEGFFIRAGAGAEQSVLIAFRDFSACVASRRNGHAYVTLRPARGEQSLAVEMSPRFGNPRRLADLIAGQYAASVG